MSDPVPNGFSKDSSSSEAPGTAEATLRLIARLPVPDGLADRIQAGLRSAEPRRARILAWPSPLRREWLHAAAAAAIVFVVAGGGWGVYSRVQPGQPTQGIAAPRVGAQGGFSEGGAVRRPQTLQGPVVAHPPANAAPRPKAPIKPATTTAAKVKSSDQTNTANPAAAPAVQ